MWANAQRDGHLAEYRWRPLFDAAKFGWLVSWSLTSLFSTNMAISETKGQGWKIMLTQ